MCIHNLAGFAVVNKWNHVWIRTKNASQKDVGLLLEARLNTLNLITYPY